MSFINRRIQKVNEIVLNREKTRYTGDTEELLAQIDKLKPWIHKMISSAEQFIDITLASKISSGMSRNKDKITANERYAVTLSTIGDQCGNFCPNLSKSLIETASAQSKMGVARKQFINNIAENYIEALRQFLNQDVVKAAAARNSLEVARLNFDSARNRMKASKSADAQTKLQSEVNIHEANFNRVHDETIQIVKNILTEFDYFASYLQKFVEAEKAYHSDCLAECDQILNDH